MGETKQVAAHLHRHPWSSGSNGIGHAMTRVCILRYSHIAYRELSIIT
jgi:hypothetical protein